MNVIEKQASNATPTRILRLPAVLNRIGISRSSFYVLIENGEFPKPINLGARSVGWLESDAEDWLSAKIQRSRSTSNKDTNVATEWAKYLAQSIFPKDLPMTPKN